ncbi:hypothetical protein D9758_003665 [Tetrapyrgos nigripes]|uniref:Sulfur carrier protein MOCS2A n=1 Tax=Tetrapyrgos nigripes TaxID=182062 RepID=A0A8H5LRP6_9AGAR|nr:hypothetical protein D9758_003665 [Tetrapyrgos nigripes]
MDLTDLIASTVQVQIRDASSFPSTTMSSASKSTSPPTITVLYFAAASTSIGLTSEEITLPVVKKHSTASEQNESESESTSGPFFLSSLPSLIISLHPDAPNLKQILEESQWSVDVEMVDKEAKDGGSWDKVELRGGEEVAVICPVSGG